MDLLPKSANQARQEIGNQAEIGTFGLEICISISKGKSHWRSRNKDLVRAQITVQVCNSILMRLALLLKILNSHLQVLYFKVATRDAQTEHFGASRAKNLDGCEILNPILKEEKVWGNFGAGGRESGFNCSTVDQTTTTCALPMGSQK